MEKTGISHTNHFIGARNELIVAEYFMSKEWEVFFPILTQSRADLVICKGGSCKRVQVKTITHVRVGQWIYKQCRLSTSNKRQDKLYSTGDFDWLVFVDNHENTLYCAPYGDVEGLTSVCFGNDNPDPKQTKKSYDVSKWKIERGDF